jgi:hypothetical protein
MHNLLSMYIEAIPIASFSWIDLGTLLSILALIAYIWRFAKSHITKDEVNKKLDKKADKEVIEQRFKNMSERIIEHEKLNSVQFEGIKEHLEEIRATQEDSNKKIDIIIQKLVK